MQYGRSPALLLRWLRVLPRGCGVLAGALGWAVLAGCATAEVPEPRGAAAVRQEIAAKIAGIRDAILAKSAEGIVRPGTDDWSFTGPDGVTFDRKGFVVRTEALFAFF